MHRLCSSDLGHRHLGQTDAQGLPSSHRLRHRAPGFLEWHCRVHAVQLIEIDMIRAETAKAFVDRRADMFGAAVAAHARGGHAGGGS